jgi:hypothetical protein
MCQEELAGTRQGSHQDCVYLNECVRKRVACITMHLWKWTDLVPIERWGIGGARGRERGGTTRSHPEPGRDPPQRRRVLAGRPAGRRGRCGHLRCPIAQSGRNRLHF